MTLPVFQHIKIKDKNVFLIHTEQTGSDFTFYLRNDEANFVRQILEEASGLTSGEAKDLGVADVANPKSQGASLPPIQGFSYSCRIHILRLRLEKKDLRQDNERVTFVSKLCEAAQKRTPPSSYNSLVKHLSKNCKALLRDEQNKRLLPTLLAELQSLLGNSKIKGLFNTPPTLTDTEKQLICHPHVKSNQVVTNYIKFCSLFNDAIKPLESRVREGRVLAGLSYKGNIWSLTFREQESGTGYDPNTSEVSDLSGEDADGNLNSIEALCQTLYEEIFYTVSHSEAAQSRNGKTAGKAAEKNRSIEGYKRKIDRHRKIILPEMSGLVVIAGSTNSAKSLVTRGLIHLYLENVLKDNKRKRRPHLITFEDPIEKYFAGDTCIPHDAHTQQDVAMEALKKKIDYTPRQQLKDRENLQEALLDALRQTPKVFFVGETRKKEDWRELIDFAGTGHLVITTAHASSLLDTMHKIFLATEAKTPADRSEVASRLLAVVHLKRAEISGYQIGALVPALWRSVPRGLNALTAEGLASLLPHSNSDNKDPTSCLGRKYFVERLLELAATRNPPDELKTRLTVKAIYWDLQGA